MQHEQQDAAILPAFSVPVPENDKLDAVWKVGKYTFRANFDSANLGLVRQGPTPSEFQLWTKRDCQDTDNERGTRSWFYFGISGQQQGDFIVMTIMNLNKQGRLFSQDYRPWCWSQSMAEWQPMTNKASYKRDGDDFQLRFSQKFDGADEMFFAFAIPYSYRDTQALLDHISQLFQHNTQVPPECVTRRAASSSGSTRGSTSAAAPEPSDAPGPQTPPQRPSGGAAAAPPQEPPLPPPQQQQRTPKELQQLHAQIYLNRQLLARSLEGRHVEILTITDCFGASEETEPLPAAAAALSHGPRHWLVEEGGPGGAQQAHDLALPCAHFPTKKVFFISARVHPGETPATHMFNGALAFLLRQNDARAAALRRLFVFKLVPVVNPDGVYHGFYRTDTLGQNLNRYYLGNPDRELQPSVWAIKRQLVHYVQQGQLEFYLDLHAHANKKGVFIYGNTLQDPEQALASLLYARLVALNSPIFDYLSCNYTEKNMSRADKDGISKEGAARVALYRETGLTHLYTIEANYNTARALNVVSPAVGEHNGRASPPSGRRFPPRFAVPVLQQVGRAFVVAALDLKGANPWSRLPTCEHRSLEGVASWIASVARSPSATRIQHLPPLSDGCVESLQRLPNCLSLESMGISGGAAAAASALEHLQQPSSSSQALPSSSQPPQPPSSQGPPGRRALRSSSSLHASSANYGAAAYNGSDSSPCSSAISVSTYGGGGGSTPLHHASSANSSPLWPPGGGASALPSAPPSTSSSFRERDQAPSRASAPRLPAASALEALSTGHADDASSSSAAAGSGRLGLGGAPSSSSFTSRVSSRGSSMLPSIPSTQQQQQASSIPSASGGAQPTGPSAPWRGPHGGGGTASELLHRSSSLPATRGATSVGGAGGGGAPAPVRPPHPGLSSRIPSGIPKAPTTPSSSAQGHQGGHAADGDAGHPHHHSHTHHQHHQHQQGARQHRRTSSDGSRHAAGAGSAGASAYGSDPGSGENAPATGHAPTQQQQQQAPSSSSSLPAQQQPAPLPLSSASVNGSANANRWFSRTRSGRQPPGGAAAPPPQQATVPLTELRIKLADPPGGGGGAGGLNSGGGGSKPLGETAVDRLMSRQARLAADALAGGGGVGGRLTVLTPAAVAEAAVGGEGAALSAAASLVLATGPWQAAHGGVSPVAASAAVVAVVAGGCAPVTPRLHSRLLAALPKPPPPHHHQQGLAEGGTAALFRHGSDSAAGHLGSSTSPPRHPAGLAMDEARERTSAPTLGGGAGSAAAHEVVSSLEPVLSNLQVVGKLPAFRHAHRRAVGGV